MTIVNIWNWGKSGDREVKLVPDGVDFSMSTSTYTEFAITSNPSTSNNMKPAMRSSLTVLLTTGLATRYMPNVTNVTPRTEFTKLMTLFRNRAFCNVGGVGGEITEKKGNANGPIIIGIMDKHRNIAPRVKFPEDLKGSLVFETKAMIPATKRHTPTTRSIPSIIES